MVSYHLKQKNVGMKKNIKFDDNAMDTVFQHVGFASQRDENQAEKIGQVGGDLQLRSGRNAKCSVATTGHSRIIGHGNI